MAVEAREPERLRECAEERALVVDLGIGTLPIYALGFNAMTKMFGCPVPAVITVMSRALPAGCTAGLRWQRPRSRRWDGVDGLAVRADAGDIHRAAQRRGSALIGAGHILGA